MKCYKHQDIDAIGLCKSCHKGVCPECSALVGGSVACAESCQEDVAALNYMVERGKKVYKNLGKQWGPSVIINGVGGAFFLSFGIYNFGRISSWLLIGLGAIMIVGGIMSAVQGKRMGEKKI
ncbi:hypothetical protein [Litoribrevibacter albus]|uniref:B box-type domain-containing protein n=1 Tax=Litoribrevibacter albus TaxID=1473156 RepID=A0AA37S960_9GAMM|nr:hypothetical protein [Litoribrevibacter albus]GLQ30891.1 hypothetical protein GCM10007876_13700 [Litoribrevibacter albus]